MASGRANLSDCQFAKIYSRQLAVLHFLAAAWELALLLKVCRGLSLNLYLLEQPDRCDLAIDFVRFMRWVFRPLL